MMLVLIIGGIITAGLIGVAVAGLVIPQGNIGINNDNGSNTTSSNSIIGTEEAIVTVTVGGGPQQGLIESGDGRWIMTTYLPVNITQTITLNKPTGNLTRYTIFADWDGIIRDDLRSEMVDENNNSISAYAAGTALLGTVTATCTEPYFVRLTDEPIAEDGMELENTTAAVSSSIAWGDTVLVRFDEPQSGVINHTESGIGIVPADYNNNNDNTYRNNGAGNQEVSGEYHLSFASLYRAVMNLPKQAEITSFLEVTCRINEGYETVPKSEFPNIFVYDVWFRIE